MPDLKPTSLDTALEHIDEGHYVFPVRANKAPACEFGFNAAVNTPEEAEELWRGKSVSFTRLYSPHASWNSKAMASSSPTTQASCPGLMA
jgi:hypothetical protein